MALLFEPRQGCHSCELSEVAVKGLVVGEAHVLGDDGELAFAAVPCVLQHYHLGVFYAQTVHVVGEGAVHLLIDVVGDVGATGADLACHVGDCHLGLIIE